MSAREAKSKCSDQELSSGESVDNDWMWRWSAVILCARAAVVLQQLPRQLAEWLAQLRLESDNQTEHRVIR